MMFSNKRAENIQLPPTPYVLNPSGDWEGNDGRWSTFPINIGDDNTNSSNGQEFRVLISTSLGTTLVPQRVDWCDSPTEEECAANRGIVSFGNSQSLGFDDSKSPQWKEVGIYNFPLPEWYNISVEGDPNAVWGEDTVGLGVSSPQSFMLQNQYVAQYAISNFFMGSLGLAVGSTGPSGAFKPNFIENMYGSAKRIASRSFGYTAGAYYRNNNNGFLGSLVFGGYDRTRVSEQGGVSISMPSKQNNTLAVGITSITYKPDQELEANRISFTNRTGGFPATIDSTFPYLILPDEVCDEFVIAFGLTFDNDTQLYTVNDTSHEQNLRLDASVSFKVSANPNIESTEFASIVLPYSALDQQASWPFYSGQRRYLPIKRTENGKFVLGRTFLQEAYIIVDYEHQNFTVAPAAFPDPLPNPSLVTIFDRDYTGLPVPDDPGSGGGLSAGAIAGIVVGIVGAFIIVAVGVFFLWRKRRQAKKKTEEEAEKPSEIDTTYAGTEIKYRRISELTGSETLQSPKDSTTGYYNADHKSIPPISELSPDSTPAELYSPPPDGRDAVDYFAAGRTRRQGGTRDRDSSGNNTPRTPIAELPGEDAISSLPDKNEDPKPFQKPPHSRSPSDNSLSTNIDEVLAKKNAPEAEPGAPATAEEITRAKAGAQPGGTETAEESTMQRRPSHTRGLSDTTVQSDSTAVSQPTPEELERWARSEDDPNRPMSPT
ncbi:hypothetical protein ACET3X_004543 [Alternaria dauci]|uniref:Peptidase A1 domain-containing protein n=1 Tax=Alternaria dauci TaxID=48095 RepID=A0ABR3UNV0_9PLEO